MNYVRNMQRPRLATILAGLALFIALGGTAAAAGGLINGKKIKKGTITAKQLKNKTITKGKLKSALVSSLKGQIGPQGETGAPGVKGETGATGAPGAPGANGIIQPLVQVQSSNEIPANNGVVLITRTVPSGQYLVTAKSNLFSLVSGKNAGCTIIDNQNHVLDVARWQTVTGGYGNVAMQAVTPAGTTSIKLNCSLGASSGSAFESSVIATPIG